MYAIFRDGGHQIRASEGETILIERREADPGAVITFDEVALVGAPDGARIGTPWVANARVTAEVLGQVRGRKIIVFKFRRRKHSMRRNGHRQDYTKVRIRSIEA